MDWTRLVKPPRAFCGAFQASLAQFFRFCPTHSRLEPIPDTFLIRMRSFRIPFLVVLAGFAVLLAADTKLERAKRFWSFQPIQRHDPPAGSGSAIDRFLLAKLAAKTLPVAPPADRATLLRRITFDLTGLPPKPAEVRAFLEDQRPDAYARVVDRLLDSPHYGERWARHWMDLVRYAETDGHEFDNDKPNAWRYRDYLIRAFNEDVPYDQLAKEHIAGDLLATKRMSRDGGFVESPLATAFYWLGENQNNPVDPQGNIVDRVDNQIDVFSKTFLGLTVACARCHDHKFDPIPTADYYSLAGFFHSMRRGEQAIETSTPRNVSAVKFAGLEWNLAGPAFEARDGVLSSGAVSNYRQGIATSSVFKIEHRYLHVRVAGKAQVNLRADEYPLEKTFSPDCDCFKWKTYELQMWQGHPAYLSLIDTAHDAHITLSEVVQSDSKTPPDQRDDRPDPFVKQESEERCPETLITLAPFDDKIGNTRIHQRGNYKTLGEEVPRRFLTVLAGDAQDPIPTSTSGRLQLAGRVVSDSNPFFARVMVNRLWQHHFGRGIVATPDNFGLTGEPPTHLELLDWLASEFRASGYSIKHMQRLMVLSSAYQMSSGASPEALEQDPANKLLSHMAVRRLEAEEVRDALVAVSGTLDEKMYGPSVPVYVSPFMDGDQRSRPEPGPLDGAGRRSIYINIRRNFLPDSLTVWDYPAPISTFGRRNASLVPAQALFLMNSELVRLEARRWAEQAPSVEQMYLEAFGRTPTSAEMAAGTKFLEGHSLADYAHVLFNTTEFVFIR